MKTNTRESGFEIYITEELKALAPKAYLDRSDIEFYHKTKSEKHYDKKLSLDKELVIQFIQSSQAEEWKKIITQYGKEAESRLIERIDDEISARGVLKVLREGIKDRGANIRLAYFKPQTELNKDAVKEYQSNIFSFIRQVHYSEQSENSVDLVLFLNGIPVFTCELKNQFTNQSITDAINQYRTTRDCREKLFKFKRCLCHFALDDSEAAMTTQLKGLATRFLPYNRGNNNASGNAEVQGKYKTFYVWEDLWTPDSVLELVASFIQNVVEETEINGRKVKEEKIIFPRYHQRDAVIRVIADSKQKGSGQNYLIQHSAGSGKSNTIAWLAYRLAELHNDNDAPVFDGVIVITDRRVLDRALSNTIQNFSRMPGLFKPSESSAELLTHLKNGVRIVSSTLQKFPFVKLADALEGIKGKNFAVIIDEAHSSQSGESAADLREVLTANSLEEAENHDQEKPFDTVEDEIVKRIKARRVKTPNISFFAFTATPKIKTLELFGYKNQLGAFVPFSLYSMKQAIEERFILDVLKNYTTYETYFGLLKKIEDDPKFDKKKTRRLLLGYVARHQAAIDKKTAIIIEHFADQIASLIGGQAKAMVVTKSRLHAVLFKQAFDKYLSKKYPFKSLVAFSGKVKHAGKEYTEAKMNEGIPEKQTAATFKQDSYKFLIAAEKFQTGFDQPLLSVMYVDKSLSGVATVQTLSRLNRTCPKKEEAFVLDFENTVDGVQESFQPYYTSTILSKATDPNILYDLERDIFNFRIFTEVEVENFVTDLYKNVKPDVLNSKIDLIVARIVEERKTEDEVEEFKSRVSDYIKKYGFISQIISFSDSKLEVLFTFLKFLIKKLPRRTDKLPLEVLEAVDVESLKIQKQGTYEIILDNKDGVMGPMGEGFYSPAQRTQETDPLSVIIHEINERYGTNFNDDDKVILNNLSQKMLQNKVLQGAILNNEASAAKIKFDEIFDQELIAILNQHFELYKKLDERPELKKFANEKLFEYLLKKVA